MRPPLETSTFERHESRVRYYCRSLPAVFVSAQGAELLDSEGTRYTDLLSACGSLNYGHNEPSIKKAAIDFMMGDGLVAALDFHTDAKLRFIDCFWERILAPRSYDYKMQFTGPTGANCIEAAIKLARKATGRRTIVAFTNAFHGVSAGALAVSGSAFARQSGAGLLLGTHRLPFEGYLGSGAPEIERFEAMAIDPSGGIDPVAAIIVETVQGEGGLNAASDDWLRALAGTARRIGALLIVDDVQAGCGRTGKFFSFEDAGLKPDIVCLAKSISGLGLPMALLLMKPSLDVWEPGEHNGTFRGNSVAFAAAAAALRLWDDEFEAGVKKRSEALTRWCSRLERRHPGGVLRKGRGMMQGLQFAEKRKARFAAELASRRGILIECCGPDDEVLKVMAPLNIEMALFTRALSLLAQCVTEAVGSELRTTEKPPEADVPRSGTVERLERDEAPLDPHDHRGDAIAGSELPHHVA